MLENRGKLLLGAKPIARHAFKDEASGRSIYNEEIQRESWSFLVGQTARRLHGRDQRSSGRQGRGRIGGRGRRKQNSECLKMRKPR